mmetsp:Transcript_6495/g.14203  ORF Transcript_6495/g.14203 Transcript_6495/m.14203 type:complete len:245 (-) Transcript_6495:280-1014(-)
MVDKLAFRMCDRQYAFHAEEVGSLTREELVDPLFHGVEVKCSLVHCAEMARRTLVQAHTRDALIVLGGQRIRVQEVWHRSQRTVEVEPMDVEYTVDGHLGMLAALDGRELIHCLEAKFDALQVAFGYKINLVQQDPVSKSDLGCGLLHNALSCWRVIIQMLLNVFGIDQGHNAIEARKHSYGLVDKEGLSHGRRVCHASGLNDNSVETDLTSRLTGCKLLQDSDQVRPHSAAYAPIQHLDNLFV